MATCYNQFGEEDPDKVPCNHTAVLNHGFTSCCRKGENCYTNGLCRHPSEGASTNYYWVEGCTDKTWKDPACSIRDPCQDYGNLYWKCLDTNSWCCNNGDPAPKSQRSGHFNTTCCNMPDFMFKAPDPQQYTTADKFRLPVSTLLSSSSRPQATSNSTISASTSFVPTPTSEVYNVSSTGLTYTNVSDPGTPVNSSNHVGVGVGLGVGLGVGVIGLSAAVIFLVRRKKRPYEAGGHSAVELPLSSPRSELYGSHTPPEKVTYEMNA